MRLYVNGFQPSMKLRTKHREGSKVSRAYHDARTPLQRLVTSTAQAGPTVATHDLQERLVALFQALDPVRLLHQLHALQEALWRHAITPPQVTSRTSRTPGAASASRSELRFNVRGCGLPTAVSHKATDRDAAATPPPPSLTELTTFLTGSAATKRTYRRAKTPSVRTWRTRADPFASLWDEIRQRLVTAPDRTAKAIFQELQQEHPGCYMDGQLRTLQRRVKQWRAHAILQFDQRWLEEELLPGQALPAVLTARTDRMAQQVASSG